MAAISLALSRGVDGFKVSDFTIGASAPGAGDAEFRFNTQDTNSVNLTRKDVIQILMAIQRAIESGPVFTTTPVL